MKVKAILPACGKGLVSIVLMLTGCTTTSPSDRFEAAARAHDLTSGEVVGRDFHHRTFARAERGSGDLFVYFGGDGPPFVRRDVIAADPTPRDPLTLGLLARGPAPAVFLGRPCYHGLMAGCHPELWTVGRYSETVVASLTAATRRLIEDVSGNVVLIGYSGGGVLALLVAERVERVDAVVTLAANLDIDHWVDLHDYSPLVTSINPVTIAGRRPDLIHLHFVGDADLVVPPSIHTRLTERLPPRAFRTLAGFDHRCCWVQQWPQLAAELDERLTEHARGRR